jgi:hypothetical protein
MIPGTTPTHTYTLPLSNNDIENLRITYEQGGKIVCQKEKADCTMDGTQAVVKLTQQDTLGFTSNANVRIQLKVLTVGGDVLISEVFKKPVEIVLDKEEI